MQQMIWRWKAWTNAKRFCIYCFSQFLTVLSQFGKWLKTYFPRNFYKLYRNEANNIPLKSYGKCKTFPCWWFSQIPSCFHVELLWRTFVCNYLIHPSVLHKWYFFCTNISHNNFFNFLRPRTWTYNINKIGHCPY